VRTHLEFTAERFGGPDAAPNSINDTIFGAELAEFLSAAFQAKGLSGVVIEEDWGWMVELKSDPFPIWLGCASYGDGEGDDCGDDWLVFIEPSKPEIRKWLKKIDTRAEVEAVARELEQILVDAGATNLVWWSDTDSGRK
jgi:hypothetical protein